MSNSDPTWTCPFCKRIWYFSCTGCICPAWQQASSPQWVQQPSPSFANPEATIITRYATENTKPISKTLVVNLFSGPGCGKSTIAAGIFHDLKWKNINCELVGEFAKDLVWESRKKALEDQIYIFGKQHHRIFRLLEQVDVIITDSPLLLTSIYDAEKRSSLAILAIEEHSKLWNYNVFLKRIKKFNPRGRIHTEAESRGLNRDILDLLDKYKQPYEVFDGSTHGKDKIVNKIFMLLEPYEHPEFTQVPEE